MQTNIWRLQLLLRQNDRRMSNISLGATTRKEKILVNHSVIISQQLSICIRFICASWERLVSMGPTWVPQCSRQRVRSSRFKRNLGATDPDFTINEDLLKNSVEDFGGMWYALVPSLALTNGIDLYITWRPYPTATPSNEIALPKSGQNVVWKPCSSRTQISFGLRVLHQARMQDWESSILKQDADMQSCLWHASQYLLNGGTKHSQKCLGRFGRPLLIQTPGPSES